jgi:hypothetical protein
VNRLIQEPDDFGVKVLGPRKHEKPKPERIIYKFNSEEITEWDLKFLYHHGEKLNLIQIAEVFDVDPKDVSRYAWYFGLKLRYQDKDLRGSWFHQERMQEEKKAKAALHKQAEQKLKEMNYKKPESVEINGKQYVDAIEQSQYQSDLEEMMTDIELQQFERKIDPISELRHTHLIALRAYRKLDRFAFAKLSGVPFSIVRFYELNPDAVIPKRIEQMYIDALQIRPRELKKIIDVLAGKRDLQEEEDREIPTFIKQQVWKRDGGKCAQCQRDRHLHYHHIKKFADGGMHTVDNLKLLCVVCHAEEHKDDRSYYLLKKMADELVVS